MTSDEGKQEATAGKRAAASSSSGQDDDHSQSFSSPPPVEKRARTGTLSSPPEDGSDTGDEDTPDLATVFGFKAGDRVEVKWNIEDPESSSVSSSEEGAQSSAAAKTTDRTITRWWGATLLPHDGRTEDSVAIRVLDYDPYPAAGFHERSQEDVIFLGEHHLVTPDSQTDYIFRREGSDYEEPDEGSDDNVVWYNEGDLNDTLNDILMSAMKKNHQVWNRLPASEQARLAETIAEKKEKLMDVLKGRKDVITSSSIQGILQEAFK
jgi:hypothetical protein